MSGINFDVKFSPELDVAQMNVLIKQLKQSLGDFGKDIKLIDGKKFASEMDKAKTATKQTNTEFDKLNTSLGKSSKSAGLFQKAFKFSVIQQSVVGLTSALAPLINEFAELDTQVKNIGTLGRKDFEEFSDIALQMAADIPGSAADMANGIYQAISAGAKGTAAEIGNFVEIAAKAGVAGLSDTTTAVNGLTSVLNAYGRSYDDANEVADIFFAGIKGGKTTFEELNSSLASFIPSASAMGVGFDQATAAIARLTAVGTPTAQAGTQMNAAFTLLAKGTTPLKAALKTVGTDLDTLRSKLKQPVEEGGGLVNVFREIKNSADASGKQLAELTGSVEAAKIIESLAGDTDKYAESLKAFDNVTAEVANGAATEAFAIAATSIKSQADGLSATISNAFSGAFSALGPQVVAGISTLNQFAPVLSGLAGGAAVFGESFSKVGGKISDFAGKSGTLVKSLYSVDAASKIANGGILTMLRTLLFGPPPIGLIIAGLAAVGAAIYFIVDALHESATEKLEDAKAEEELAKQNRALAEEQVSNQQKRIKSAGVLAKEYERLGNIAVRTEEQERKYLEIQNSLTQAYPEAISGANGFEKNLANLRAEIEKDTEKLDEYTESVRQAKIEEAKAAATTAQAQVGVDVEELTDTLDDGLNDFFNTGFEVRENNGIIESLAKGFTDAANANDVLVAKGKALEFVTNTDDLTPEERAAAVDKINKVAEAQLAAIDANSEALRVEYEQSLDRLNEQFQTGGIDFAVDDTQIKHLSEQFNIPLEEVQSAVDEMEKSARQSRVGEILAETSKVQGNLKQVTRLDDLVKAFNEAETDAQKAKIGGVIEEIAPSVIKATGTIEDANGDLVRSYDLVGGELENVKQAQSEQFGGDLLAKQRQFVDAISEEGEQYKSNRAELDKLKAEIDKGVKAGVDTSEAEAQFEKLSGQNQTLLGEVVESTAKMAKQGEVSNEIYAELGAEFGISGEALKEMVSEAQGLTDSLEDSVKSVEELGSSFKGAMDEAKKIATDSQGALAELNRLRREGQIDDIEYEERKQEIVDSGKQAIADVKQLEKDNLAAEKLLGIEKKKTTKSTKSRYDIIKEIYDLKVKELDSELEQFEIAQERERLEAGRTKTQFDEVALQDTKLQLLKEQKDALLEQFKVTEDNEGNLSFGIRYNQKDQQKIKDDLADINSDIAKEENSSLELQLKINKTKAELDKELAELRLDRLETKLDLAITDSDRQAIREKINSTLRGNVTEAQKALADIVAKMQALPSEGLTAQQEIELKQLQKQQLEYQKLITDTNEKIIQNEKKTLDEKLSILKKEQDERIAIVEESLQEEEDLRTSIIETTGAVALKQSERNNKTLLDSIENEKNERLDALKNIENSEELKAQIEANYQAKRLEQEKDFQQQQKAIQAIQQGELLEAKRQTEIKSLQAREEAVNAELALLRQSENPDEATIAKIKELDSELGSITDSIAEKSDLMNFAQDRLAGGLNDTFSQLFQGNAEDLKEPFRESLQVVGGVLKAQASAAVSKLVLDELLKIPGLGIAGLLLAPILKGVIQSGVSALLNPVIGGLTSFSTGGRVDKPTAAIVGDASAARAGSNTEWIFRDDQLALMMGATALKVANTVVPKMGVEMANYQAQIVSNSLKGMIGTLYPVMHQQTLTTAKLSQIMLHQLKYMNMINRYSGDSAISQLARQGYKVNSYATGSGALTSPELALVGDANVPEYVIRQDQLDNIVKQSREAGGDMTKVVSELNDIKRVLASVKLEIGDETIYLASERERQRNSNRSRG